MKIELNERDILKLALKALRADGIVDAGAELKASWWIDREAPEGMRVTLTLKEPDEDDF